MAILVNKNEKNVACHKLNAPLGNYFAKIS